MKRYVLGFLFNDDLSQVTLIRKNKPEWQKGRWNGIGGKIETTDETIAVMMRKELAGEEQADDALAAMYREAREEADILLRRPTKTPWTKFAILGGDTWEVHVFFARESRAQAHVRTLTDEEVKTFRTEGVLSGVVQDLAGPTIGNIKWLVQLALAVATGEDHCSMFHIHQVEVETERRPRESVMTATEASVRVSVRPHVPSKEVVEAAKKEIEQENEASARARNTPEREAVVAENRRRSSLPSEHPEHVCGMMCDGQDGQSSYCARLRMKLFGRTGSFR